MAEIYFDKIDCTFYDNDDSDSIKKNIDTLFTLIHQQGLFSLDWIAEDTREYKSYFMRLLKILVIFLASDAYHNFFTKWIEIETELIEKRLDKESKYHSINKALKQILLDSFEFMGGDEERKNTRGQNG